MLILADEACPVCRGSHCRECSGEGPLAAGTLAAYLTTQAVQAEQVKNEAREAVTAAALDDALELARAVARAVATATVPDALIVHAARVEKQCASALDLLGFEQLGDDDDKPAPCEHPNRVPAMRLPPGCFRCPDCGAVFRVR